MGIKLGVSACLIGNKCRYDGSDAKDHFVSGYLSNYFEFVAYCPEEIIFGSPRDTLRIVEVNGQNRIHVSKTAKDVTDELEKTSHMLVENASEQELCGFILKSKSPTCGMERVKVYKQVEAPSEKKGVGVFAQALRKKFPYLPIEEEGRLNDPWLKENFMMQVFAYSDFMNFEKNASSLNQLVKFHTSYKYLIFAKYELAYKNLGQIVANHEKKNFDLVMQEYKENFLAVIAKKGSIQKTYNVLLHIYGYFKKEMQKAEKDFVLQTCEEYKKGIVPLIAVIKLLNLYVQKQDQAYLKDQKFLQPYPEELALRSDVKAYK